MFKFGGIVDDYGSDIEEGMVLEPYEIGNEKGSWVSELFDLEKPEKKKPRKQSEKKADLSETLCVKACLGNELASVFPFECFNKMQSKCFELVFHSNMNLVISAPTASGKTVVFEIAICKIITDGNPESKVVYISPYKALCQQVFREWSNKFKRFSMSCVELTGDCDLTSFPDIQQHRIMFVQI